MASGSASFDLKDGANQYELAGTIAWSISGNNINWTFTWRTYEYVVWNTSQRAYCFQGLTDSSIRFTVGNKYKQVDAAYSGYAAGTRSDRSSEGYTQVENGTATLTTSLTTGTISVKPRIMVAGKELTKNFTLAWNVVYDANGGTGSTATQMKKRDTALSISANGFSRMGYAFGGWNTMPDGSGTGYYAGQSYTGNAGLTLYAQWIPQQSLILSLSAAAETQGTIVLQMDRKVNTYYHIATISYSGTTLYTSSAFATDLTVSVPRSWFDSFPNNATINVTVSVNTYTDSTCTTQIGISSTGTTAVTADAGVKPTVSAGWASVAAYNAGAVSGMTGYIKGFSKAEATFDGTKVTNANGATTASFSVTCQGETASASPYRTGILASAGTINIVCTVTDTRGRTASETLSVSVMDYAGPGVTNTGIWRGDSSGNEDDDGTYMRVLASSSCTSLNGQNSATLTVATQASGGSWSAETSITSGVVTILSGFDADTTYTVRVTVTDALGNTSSYSESVPKRKWAMKFRASGEGVAFGMAPQSDKVIQTPDDWRIQIGDSTQYVTYSSVTELGLTSGSATIAGAYAAMPDLSILICDASDFTTSTGGVPNVYGTVQITKFNDNRTAIQFFGKTTAGDCRMFCDLSTGVPTGSWIKLLIGSVLVMAPSATTNIGFTPQWALVDWYNSVGSFKTQIVGSGWKIYDFAGNDHGYLTFANDSVTNNTDVYLTIIALA